MRYLHLLQVSQVALSGILTPGILYQITLS